MFGHYCLVDVKHIHLASLGERNGIFLLALAQNAVSEV